MSAVAKSTEINGEDFVPAVHEMDLRPLMAYTFIVAVSTGDRNDGKLLAKTIHGPYDFAEMVGTVGDMWAVDQNNAKVYILEKDRKAKPRWLDVNTTDFIAEKYATILLELMIENFDDKQYTVEAGVRTEEIKPASDDATNSV